MPEGAAEFAVGDALKPDRFLEIHRIHDGAVLHGAQFGPGNLALGGFCPCLMHLGRAQQRTDVVGAKGRLLARNHGFSPRRVCAAWPRS